MELSHKKKNILIIWHRIPEHWDASTSRIFYLLKHSKKQNNKISIITFKNKNIDDLKHDIPEFDGNIILIDYPNKLTTITNTFMNCIISKNIQVPLSHYSFKMKKKIKEIVKSENFDLIYCHQSMLFYILKLDVNVPKIIDILDPMIYSTYNIYLQTDRMMEKILYLSYYYYYKYLVVPKYQYFDALIFVTDFHKKYLDPFVTIKNSFCVPWGVDIEYYKPLNTIEQNIIFTGSMGYLPNSHAIIFFYKEILPLIKKQIPEIKLYVVGNNPNKDVLKLRSNDIIVTGFVKDIRPYIANASVVVVPMIIDDGGFKVKILESMAMGKSIVSTSIGAKGIEIAAGENIIIADKSEEFAEKVIELLNDAALREKIGKNARKLVEEKYSWNKTTDNLNHVFHILIKKNMPINNI